MSTDHYGPIRVSRARAGEDNDRSGEGSVTGHAQAKLLRAALIPFSEYAIVESPCSQGNILELDGSCKAHAPVQDSVGHRRCCQNGQMWCSPPSEGVNQTDVNHPPFTRRGGPSSAEAVLPEP